MYRLLALPSAVIMLFCLQIAVFGNTVVDFEGFADSTILTNQYSGLSFTNAIILTAGIGLNEYEAPPHSGTNVVSDNNGPMTIDFLTPVTSVGGYFTYYEPLSIQAFDTSLTPLLPVVTSAFSINVGCDPGPVCLGDPSSSPNEFLSVTSPGGISQITITGDPLGGSFAMDDLTYTPAAVPEPNSVYTVLTGLVAIATVRKLS